MKQEIEVLACINHPNIIRIYELLEDDINYYIVSEILEGGELYNHIVDQHKFGNFTI